MSAEAKISWAFSQGRQATAPGVLGAVTVNPRTLFLSDEIEVAFLQGSEELLLITFSAMDFSTETEAFWGCGFARKAGFSALGFVARFNNWYPSETMRRARESVQSVLGRYPRKITYGSSMGAYAAAKYSALLGAEACAAFSPQHSIDPADGAAVAYSQHFQPTMHSGMAISAADLCPRPYVFFDPFNSFDKQSAQWIRAQAPNTNFVLLPHAGHECIKVIASLSNASAVLRTCLFGEPSDVRALMAGLRRASSARAAGLTTALLPRRPKLAFRVMERAEARMDTKQRTLFHEKVATMHVEGGDLIAAEAHAARACELYPERSASVRLLASIYERQRRRADAIECYERYLRLRPNETLILDALAALFLIQKHVERAESYAAKALELAPSQAFSLRRMSQVRAAQNRVEEATALLRQAAQADPKNELLKRELASLEKVSGGQ